MQFLTFKFFFAVLPLLILGYILGVLVVAAIGGYGANPLFILLDGIGILIGLLEFRERMLIG